MDEIHILILEDEEREGLIFCLGLHADMVLLGFCHKCLLDVEPKRKDIPYYFFPIILSSIVINFDRNIQPTQHIFLSHVRRYVNLIFLAGQNPRETLLSAFVQVHESMLAWIYLVGEGFRIACGLQLEGVQCWDFLGSDTDFYRRVRAFLLRKIVLLVVYLQILRKRLDKLLAGIRHLHIDFPRVHFNLKFAVRDPIESGHSYCIFVLYLIEEDFLLREGDLGVFGAEEYGGFGHCCGMDADQIVTVVAKFLLRRFHH